MLFKEETARQKLADILSKKEYQVYNEDNRNALQRLWDDIKSWLAEWLERLFPSIENASSSAGNVMFILVAMVVFALAVILIITISRIRINRRVKSNQPFTSEDEWSWTYRKHMEKAEDLENQQEYTLATRHLFLAMLLYCHEQEWLEAKIWKTNWEYYDELKANKKDFAASFYHLAQVFDRATYGKQSILKEEYLPYRDRLIAFINTNNPQERSV
ncbi:hypothetical protein FIU87_10605 [Bacillus sp. THAF10]|uniref:DUF4129 domain-containing protein n=1 Tax=Bacillus sp. THAF10 TaxID=2587848 RepID=UPI001268331A|nr:DUF4129 domain-containing protein [Bacillus sp. THAF10]QFT89097.1 hypothetical protein FIU87_10605 [Bacillus sp. THAF10]